MSIGKKIHFYLLYTFLFSSVYLKQIIRRIRINSLLYLKIKTNKKTPVLVYGGTDCLYECNLSLNQNQVVIVAKLFGTGASQQLCFER